VYSLCFVVISQKSWTIIDLGNLNTGETNMTESIENHTSTARNIRIIKNGPYVVSGDIPLVKKSQVVSEYGEPLTWKTDGQLSTEPGEYTLCRCGQSAQMPFCDRTHRKIAFDGTECADEGRSAGRRNEFPGGGRLIVSKDNSLCMESGFCGLRNASLEQFAAASADPQARSLAIAMVERCPSGALTYRIERSGPNLEPDLPVQVADSTEITSDGPIAGPLWVSGGIPIQRSDGKPMETRNRVTLCNCGASNNKPLCDGTHRHKAEELKRAR
jgi:CDGSH-type Zn-finger protein/uncharacterized Fe-S cluster protein YjdI